MLFEQKLLLSRRVKMKKLSFLTILLFVVIVAVAMPAVAQEKCPLCGMNVAEHQNTAFVVEKTSGESVTYCCPHCGLWIMAKEADTVKSAKARDFISGEWVNAKDAVYVFHSKAVPACSPSWIAFAKKKEAEMFKKGFGGEVLSYDAAIKKRETMPKGMEMK
jgi:nitrous oxide reductase accessory protein NosL